MEHTETRNIRSRPHSPGHVPAKRLDPLQWLEISFTSTGFAALKEYRVALSRETGRAVTLGQSLDALIKSHPFVTGAEVSP